MSSESASSLPDPYLGALLEGRYRVVVRLGEGAMSAVYRAQQLDGGPDVAIKILHEELIDDESQRERFEREARALFGMEHPNILHVLDFGFTDGKPFLAMELLEGVTLDSLVEERPLPPMQALDFTKQILRGLAYAHAQGALHRDVKTENVFIARGPDGRALAKLLDFGLVKFVDDDRWGAAKALTTMGEIFGSPAYMSPEQCTGAPVDARTDVYAMGVVLTELLTGGWPFMKDNRMEMIRAHLMATPPALAELYPDLEPRPELDAIVQKALAKDREARFADAGEMLAALEAVPHPAAAIGGMRGQDAETFVPDVPFGTAPPATRPTALLVGGAVLVAVVVLGGLFLALF